jgi:signal transduction histidine kinase
VKPKAQGGSPLLPIVNRVNAAGHRSLPISRVYLVGGLAATAIYFLLPWGSFVQTLFYDGIGASAAAASVVGARIFRPSLRLPWYLFAAGLLAFSVGDVIFNLYAFVWHRDTPVPSVADIFYLAGYPLLTAGLVLLVRCLRSEERRTGRLDAAMLIAALALFQWVFLIRDRLHTGSIAERAVAFAYPAMDVILLAALVFFALTPTWRTVAYRYLAASVLLLILADEIYGLSPASYTSASWLDSAWLLSYVLWGVAALHPSMRELSEPAAAGGPRVSRLRLAWLAAALATAPAILLGEALSGSRIDGVAIAVTGGLLCTLVVLRLTNVIRTLDRLRSNERLARAEAETAERLLAEQNERLREADRVKDEFVALISHDLRTPLTSITGYVELALEEELPDEVRGYLQVVDRNADRLLALVNDLLFVARLQAGELRLEPEDLDLAGVVEETVAALQPRAAAKRIALTYEIEGVAPVHADRGRLHQLFDNLVSNGLKFTPEGGRVHVLVAMRNGSVHAEVSDTGIGIDPDDQQRLFERFFRTPQAVEQQVPGTGLGLYISRVIAEAHEGSLSVRSTPGRGSTFSLDLPLARAAILV